MIFPNTSSPNLNKLLNVVIIANILFPFFISKTRSVFTEVTSSTLFETIHANEGLKSFVKRSK